MSDASVSKREMCEQILNRQIGPQVTLEDAKRLARAHLELLDKCQWQPIETAPKDGSVVLLAKRSNVIGPHQFIEHKGPCGKQWYSAYQLSYIWVEHPTHWMPLPDPPEAK
jgi:hypothetical protein